MAFLEYILLAFIWSTGAVAPAAGPPGGPGVSLGAGAISQPRGGTMSEPVSGTILPVQCTGGDKARPRQEAHGKDFSHRYHKGRHHRRSRPAAESGKKPIKQ